jgi:hypothetical protein
VLLIEEFAMTLVPESSSPDWPTVYRIRVQGVLDPSWSARLEGLHIEVQRCADQPPSTLLCGRLQDQAALNGVLTTLYALGFTLLSVRAT